MSDQPRTEFHANAERAARDPLVEDLERRLDALEALDESDVGSFTRLDWFLCIAGSIVLPVIAIWWFAG